MKTKNQISSLLIAIAFILFSLFSTPIAFASNQDTYKAEAKSESYKEHQSDQKKDRQVDRSYGQNPQQKSYKQDYEKQTLQNSGQYDQYGKETYSQKK
jgi:hypothetical protein